MVLLEGKYLQHSLTIGELPGTMYSGQWVDGQ